MVKVVICGASGRMGQTLGRMVHESDDLELVGGINLKPSSFFGAEIVEAKDADALLKRTKADVVIDFTIASAVVGNVQVAARNNCALIIGTTGISPAQRAEMEKAILGHVPAVITTNFSIGVAIFQQLVRESARLLKDYDIELIEAHHRNKKDAPSGTAKTLLQIIEEEAGTREKLYGREGMTERKNEIGVHVIRGGDIVGDHKVMYSKNFETIELSHRAYDRSVFASGALRAARWVVGKKPGIYDMNDVLGLKK
ncbi:4-hydroxy-tetrahydrodipicolinate reductase [Methanoregula formicica]|uniref:4-hydroxy-tetrahydrodipicolinate reductase n=1 Tax=Methanoregula formicica (strain DSM 22288 / NBRC 105244 / SMSP) TaxID=593750 RepID=L0HDK2_METFS|nr:4-hydroxy-tetrahydrodipicolinate reductase [Methanoregula formicica]AGB02797.1 dihydrodipicolinate reductase [Methanoregula formicica SMSP]